MYQHLAKKLRSCAQLSKRTSTHRSFYSTRLFTMPFVIANKKRIHYKDWAPKSGSSPRDTIVLIHGLGSSQNYYTALVPSLIAQDYRCVCLDTTGQGRSPYTFYEQSIHSLAADIVGVMDELKIQKAIVVGHSMAGITCPELAAEWPDRVSSLVLLGPVYPSKEATPVFEQRIAAVEKSGMEAMADTVPWAAVGSSATPIQHAIIRELLLGQDPAGYISMCRVIASSYKNPPDYKKVTCPTLIIAGEEDKSAPLEGCKKVLNQISSQKKDMVVQKKIGHWMAVEVPEDCAQEILKFLQ